MGFERTLDIGLEHQVQDLGLGIGLAGQEGFQRHLGGLAELAFALLGGPGLGDAAGDLFVLDHGEGFAGLGHALEALDLHRHGRSGLLDLVALVVEERPHPAGEDAADEGVALVQGAFLDEHRGHRAPALVQAGFDDMAPGQLVRIGL